MQLVSGNDVHKLCDWQLLVEGLAEAHRAPRPLVSRAELHSAGNAGERQTFFSLLAWQPGIAMGTKIITVMPLNPQGSSGLPTGQAAYVLFDGENGSPLAVLDGTALSHFKTAADSALGAKLLAREDASTFLMVGAGALAPYMIEAHRSVRPSINRVLIWNRTRQKAEDLARICGGEVVCDLQEAVGWADIICCATASTKPIVMGSWLKPGVHLDLVGGFTPDMRECDDTAVKRCRLFVDSWMFGVDQPGDIADPLSRGVITRDKIEADLFDLCMPNVQLLRNYEDLTLFKNGGGGHLDLFTALFISRRLGLAGAHQESNISISE